MLKKIFTFIAQGILGLLLMALFGVMFVEWMAGCGESYVDSKGKTHANECIIINHGK